MSISTIDSATTTSMVEPLMKKLVGKIDRNGDGEISSNEFGAFLTSIINAAPAIRSTAQASAQVADATPDLEESPDILPSTWTANYESYGTTFAGFSPQDHTDLTLEDLGVPGKAEKYAVFNYLLSNRIKPTNDWAPAAAEALNKKYDTTVYKAIDGETLGYGNEYVHSASNGYGMAAGTYSPSATGEFFWGWSEPDVHTA
jgi:hypothetical protein